MKGETPLQPTRWEILKILKKRGQATVQELSQALGMTLMGVRLHLVVIERDGYVQRSAVRDKPGRPALVYSLTPRAEEVFPKRYDLLAGELLDAISTGGTAPEGGALLEGVAHSMAAPLVRRLEGVAPEERVQAASRMLDEMGGFTSWEKVEGGYLLHQYNCLFYSIARERRQLCAMDEQFYRDLLGSGAHRQRCMMDGKGPCSYFVPDPPAPQSHAE